MAVAVDLELTPSLEEVRELAREHSLVPLRHTFIADCETPVSAYLKLRGDGPSFLLESAEQGQQVGRWSFLGFRPRAVIRAELGDEGDPYALVDAELARYEIAPLEGLPPFAGGAVGMFGYDLARSAEPSIGEPNPDDTGMPRLAASRRSSRRTWAPAATPRRSSARRSTSVPATSTRWSRASAGAPTARSTRSRSTAASARSTRARTCTSWTSRTLRSRGLRQRL